jgi:Pentapeptide repeats (8 copies)/NACHT domain
MANSLWPFRRTTGNKKLAPTKMLDGTASVAKVVFELSEALKPGEGKPQVKELASLVNQLGSLLDILNSPLGEVIEKSFPFVPIFTGLLRFAVEKNKVQLTRENCIALVFQAAYVESFRFSSELFSKEEQSLLKSSTSGSNAFTQELKTLAKIDVSCKMADDALNEFPISELAHSFGKVLQARLVEAGFSKEDAQRLTKRVAWYTPRYLYESWAASPEAIKHLGQTTFPEWRTEQARYHSLEDYLKEVIQPGPDESVFGESSLTFRKLYVPLEIKRLDEQGIPASDPCDIGKWVEDHLLDSTNKNKKEEKILFIQGEAGRGKSVFCRMFADQVMTFHYPSYTPILIRLKEIRHLAQNLGDTLKNILATRQFVTDDNSWLTRKDTRFLFLLDGFDELFLEGRGNGEGLEEFLEQVQQFQRDSDHRFIITGRPLTLQGTERLISQAKQLQRAELQPMSNPLRKKWFSKWAAHFKEETDTFKCFLSVCPPDVGDVLAREPLLLYLLGRMHHEGQLKASMFEATEGIQAKVVIYDKVVRWVIEEQRKNENLTGLDSADLRDALKEVAVCVTQSGNEVAKVSFLEARLFDKNAQMHSRLRKARQRMKISKKKLLNNILTTFYIKPASGDREGSMEFVHKSFGEFLFAERLAYALKAWSTKRKDQKSEGDEQSKWSVLDKIMHREIYDLLGYGCLSKEIVDYTMARLKPTQTNSERLEDTQWCLLSDRLQNFSLRWWEGEFINAVQLPQWKMLSLREQIPEPPNLRQVDAYVGLNALILLLELHRYGQSQDALKQTLAFYPCGPEKAKFKTSRLNRIIGYSECIEARAFGKFIGPFLSYANLSRADFSSTNLIGADLRGSDLSRADLSRTDLRIANLSGANLSGVNFCRANLSYANLSKANLISADLIGVDLSDANLSDANLSDANLHLGQLDQAILCRTTLQNGTVSHRDCKKLTGGS